MAKFGVPFGVAVAAGVASAGAFPLSVAQATLIALSAGVLAARNAGSWFLVPFAWGLFVCVLESAGSAERAVRSPLAARGWIEVEAREGRGAVVRIGERRILVAKADSLGLSPGTEFLGLLRLDSLVGLEEPAGFRAERWARTRHLDGRGRPLGPIEGRRPRAGVQAFARRAGEATRLAVRARLVGPGGPSGELLVALILGDRTGLDPADREAFRRAGLAHVLALSGMHVSLLALGLGSVLGALRFGRRATFAFQSIALVAFTILTGCLAPVVRSCGTALLAGAAVLLERRSDALHALGLVGGAMLLADPVLFDDLGFRLSFSATALLVISASPKPERGSKCSRVRAAWNGLRDSLRISTAIVIGTGADLAATMGRVSVLAPVTNLLSAIPSFAALGWGAFAAFAPLPGGVVSTLARSARLANESILEICRAAAGIPGGDLPIPAPAWTAAALALGAASALARGVGFGRRGTRAALVALALASASAAPRDRVTFLDVGQGDAVLLELGTRRVLVDAGPPDARPSLDGSQLAERAVRRRVAGALDAAVLTHAHLDHGGGLAPVIERRLARALVLPVRAPGAIAPELAGELALRAKANGVALLVPGSPNAPLGLAGGGIQVFVPWPAPGPPIDAEENDLSLVVRWNAGPLGALLTGDLEKEGEAVLLEHPPPRGLGAWILKAGHHGGRASNAERLLDAAAPRVFVVSCGEGNTHGHPHAETIARAAARRIVVLRTDHAGSIAFTRTARGVRIRWERGYPCALGRSRGFA